jgi:hypothetical protein
MEKLTQERTMFINQSMQTYSRPMMPSMRQQFRQQILGLFGPKVLWVAVGKVLLIFCPLLLLVNFWLSSSAERMATAILAAEEGRYLLVNENITLRAERARLNSPGNLNQRAANQFALYVPGKGQVTRF